jgi:hypothetical protein
MNTPLLDALPVDPDATDSAECPPTLQGRDGKPPQAFGIFQGGRPLGVHETPLHVREQALLMGIDIFFFAAGRAAP